MTTIAVFAGYGGSDAGAVANGRREEDITLEVSNAVTALLQKWGYTVINNRTTNINRNITADALLAKESNADALIEIHMNSNDGKPGSGAEAFISIKDKERARILASTILQRLEKLGYPNRGVMTSVNAVGRDSFGILRMTEMPAVLLECAFINNPEEMAHFNIDEEATAIAESIRDVFPLNGSSNEGALPAFSGGALQLGSKGDSVWQVQHCLNRVACVSPTPSL